jgi:hypothetical protein
MRLILFIAATGCVPLPDDADTGDSGDAEHIDDTGDTGDAVGDRDCSMASMFGYQPDFDSSTMITGWVTAPSGTVDVAGARVAVDVGGEEVWTMSGARGCFRIDVPTGQYELTVSMGRYTAAADLEVTADALDLGSVPLDPAGARLAVVHGDYDAIGSLLDELGLAYSAYATPEALYGTASALAQYDVVFAACGSLATTTKNNPYTSTQLANVAAYIEGGGTVYASDWEHPLVSGATEQALFFTDNPNVGPATTLAATLLDRDVIQLIGSDTLDITFDLPQWSVIDDVDLATPLVVAELPDMGEHPLAAVHHQGDGRLFYTSFHNDAQATSQMQAVLLQLILAL